MFDGLAMHVSLPFLELIPPALVDPEWVFVFPMKLFLNLVICCEFNIEEICQH